MSDKVNTTDKIPNAMFELFELIEQDEKPVDTRFVYIEHLPEVGDKLFFDDCQDGSVGWFQVESVKWTSYEKSGVRFPVLRCSRFQPEDKTTMLLQKTQEKIQAWVARGAMP